jgi:formamidopyrimidine-DNA glycosylase
VFRIASDCLTANSDYTHDLPELPEVEAVCRRLRESIVGATIVHARILRPSVTRPQTPAQLTKRVADARIESVTRRGKHILIHMSDESTLHVHLRMTGNLFVIPDIRLRTVFIRAYFELADGRALVFEDPRLLGKIHLHKTAELESLLRHVGLEPSQMTADQFAAAAKKARKAIKLFLMDQKHVSGLGNIYAAESLFRAGIHPAKLGSSLSLPRLRKLHQACVSVLADAMDSVYPVYADPGRFADDEWFPVAVYDREGDPCNVCATAIRRIPQGGRSTYFCPRCQK